MIGEKHSRDHSGVFRCLFLQIVTVASLSGCALFNPYVHSDHLFDQCYSCQSTAKVDTKQQDGSQADATTQLRFAGDLANAIDDAADQRNLYLRAARQYAYVRNGGALAAAGLGATALYVGVTQNEPGNLLAALGIGAASALGLSSYFDNRPRQLLYFAGARVIGCVILSFRPLLVTVEEASDFAAALGNLDEAIVAATGVGIIAGNDNKVGGKYDPARIGQVMASAQDIAAKARRFAADLDTAGLALREKTIAVVTQIDEQLSRTEPDPRSITQLVGGLGSTAGALVPGAKFSPPAEVSRQQNAPPPGVNEKIDALVAAASRVSLMLDNFGRVQIALDASDACKVPVAEGGISVSPANASVDVQAGSSAHFSVTGGGIPTGALTGDFPADSFKLAPELGQGVIVMRVDTLAAAAGHEAALEISDAAHLATHRTLIRAVAPAKREPPPAAQTKPDTHSSIGSPDPVQMVKMAQRYLGVPDTATSTDLDTTTTNAVRQFQEIEGIKPALGTLDPDTLAKIESVRSPESD